MLSNPKFKDYCANCRKDLNAVKKILFVEQEIGRSFCSEECICEYFQPTVELMNEDLEKLRSDYDISPQDHQKFLKYRSLTLQDPDEVWVKQTDTGDQHYVYISAFNKEESQFHYVVISLALQGEPSFVFLSFPTTDQDLLDFYRDGVELKGRENAPNLPKKYLEYLNTLTPETTTKSESSDGSDKSTNEKITPQEFTSQGPANSVEMFKQALREHRHPTDIPENDFNHFDIFVDPTLEDPDEIWTIASQGAEGKSVLDACTFITRFSNENGQDFYMIVITTPEEQDGRRTLSVALAFPTIDEALVQLFRKGINSLNKAFGIGSTLAA